MQSSSSCSSRKNNFLSLLTSLSGNQSSSAQYYHQSSTRTQHRLQQVGSSTSVSLSPCELAHVVLDGCQSNPSTPLLPFPSASPPSAFSLAWLGQHRTSRLLPAHPLLSIFRCFHQPAKEEKRQFSCPHRSIDPSIQVGRLHQQAASQPAASQQQPAVASSLFLLAASPVQPCCNT